MEKGPCPHIGGCEMYGLFQLKGALRVWQVNYCEDDYSRCARYIRSSEGLHPPANLLPNGKLLALDPTGGKSK